MVRHGQITGRFRGRTVLSQRQIREKAREREVPGKCFSWNQDPSNPPGRQAGSP